MGHLLLGELPKTRNWIAVVKLLRLGSPVEDVAAATALAAETELQRAASDPAFKYTVWLLTQLPLAARSDSFSDRLQALGFEAGAGQSVLSLINSFGQAVDNQTGHLSGRNDLGVLARHAAVEALSGTLASGTASMFDVESETLQRDLSALATKTKFPQLSRDFFARLTQKTLEYYLSRAVPDHVGTTGALRTINDQIDFRLALEKHCREASVIVEEFAGGWYAKKNFKGELTPEAAHGFGDYALKKMRDELRARRAAND